ncbi:MAG TPA: phage virion morphogenesis protein [Thermoanaerobaculia bacterium]|jgi:hypothetical protein|nr:phage virion morphogenesis protein [Thermoanaerobaculia bacterium]
MARRIGSYATFEPSEAFTNDLGAMIERGGDLSPAMEQVARIGYEDVIQRLQSGGDGWPALSPATIKRWGEHQIGVGEHGGFGPTLRRDWSKKNAVVYTRAPHAHLFGDGTLSHSIGGKKVSVYNSKRGHLSRSISKSRIAKSQPKEQEPARPYMYFSEQAQTRMSDTIYAHLFGEQAAA